jgi:hypothetical protein
MHKRVTRRRNESVNSRLAKGLAICTVLVSVSVGASFAASHNATGTVAATTSSAVTTPAKASDPQKETRLALTALRLLGESARELDQVTVNLYADTMNKKVTMDDSPDLIPDSIITQVPDYAHGHYLVPNQKWVDYHLKCMGTLFRYVHDEIDHVHTPDSCKESTSTLFGKLEFLMQDIHQHYVNLLVDKSKGKFGGPLMATEAKAIHDDIQKFEDTRRQIYVLIRDQAKKS